MFSGRYPVLFAFSAVIRGLAVINALTTVWNFFKTVATPVVIQVTDTSPDALQQLGIDFQSTVLGLLGGGLLLSLAVYAAGEFIWLAIEAEENQRRIINNLRLLREMEKDRNPNSQLDTQANVWKAPGR